MGGVQDRGCARALEWGSLEADGELSQLERELLARHLRRCPACAARVAEVRALTGVLRSAPLERPRQPVFTAGPARARRSRPLAVRIAAAATLAALAAGLGVLAGSVGGGPGAPVPTVDSDVALAPTRDTRHDGRGPRPQPEPDLEDRRGPEPGEFGGV